MIFYFLVFSVFFMFGWGSDCFIKVLIYVEFMTITLVGYYCFFYGYGFFGFIIYFLVMGVCEGVLGLSVLSVLISCFGSDYLVSFSLIF